MKGKEKEDLYEIFLISKETIIETEVSFFSNSILFVNSVTPSTLIPTFQTPFLECQRLRSAENDLVRHIRTTMQLNVARFT